jgi:hypothetical protein
MRTIAKWIDKHLSLCVALLIGAVGVVAAGGLAALAPSHAAYGLIPMGIAGVAVACSSSKAH